MPIAKNIDKDLLYDLYYNKNLSAKEICKQLGISQPITIYKYMDLYGFKRRNINQQRRFKTMHGMDDETFKQFLLKEYKVKSLSQIAKDLNVSTNIVCKYMDQYGIPRHKHKEANAIFNKGNHNNYKGGRASHGDGYIKLLMPEHPRAINGYVLEHIVIAERKIGRSLTKEEVVHHINGIKDDNRPENLIVLTKKEHSNLHKNGSNIYKSISQIQKEGDFNGC